MLRKLIRQETVADSVVPYVHHTAPKVVRLDDGSRMAMYRIAGRQAETAALDEVDGWSEQLNGFLKNIASDRVTVTTHLVRRGADEFEFPGGEMRSAFARDLDREYTGKIAAKLYLNELFLTVRVRPRVDTSPGLISLIRSNLADKERQARLLEPELEELCQSVESFLAPYGPQRIGTRQEGLWIYSEIAEVLHLVLTGVRRKIPITTGRLGRTIYQDRIVVKWDTITLLTDVPRYAAMLRLRDYPAETIAGQFSILMSAPYFFTLTQSFVFLRKSDANTLLSRKSNQMLNVNDRAISQREEITREDGALDQLESNVFVMGTHHLSLMVFADGRDALSRVAAEARSDMADTGAVVAREDIALEAAYWAQLPGNEHLRTRPAAITSHNFSHMEPLFGFPAGPREGFWGEPVMVFRTSGGTPYRYHLHVEDVGNTVVFGPTGSGKTTLMLAILSQAERLGANVVFFDKDRGGEIAARALGGDYLVLPIGRPTGCAPLRALSNAPEDVAFLTRWIGGLITASGYTLKERDRENIDQGVRAIMSFRPEYRSMGELRAWLGQTDQEGAGKRLERWCDGSGLGWAFDGAADEIGLDAPFLGFDMTDVLDDADVRGPMMSYLFHRVGKLVDGRRQIIAVDEFWRALLEPAFQDEIHDQLKTFRKRNAPLILATQSVRDALQSRIAHTLIEQCPTQILMPNPRASEEDYLAGLKLTETEFNLVRNGLVGTRKFLLKQGSVSVVPEFDLSGMNRAINVLSGRAASVRLLDTVRQDGSEDWLREFHERMEEAAA